MQSYDHTKRLAKCCSVSHMTQLWSCIWTNLNLLHQRILWSKFSWNWSSSSRDVINVFLLFWYYFPFDKEVPIHLNKLESTSPKDAFIVQSLIEIGPVVLWKIFKCCQLEKGNALHLINLESLYPWVYVLVTSSRNTELFQTFYEKNLNFIHDTMIIQVNILILQFCAKSCMLFSIYK